MDSDKEISWRELELLVAHIEDQLSPKGAIVNSPDKVLDNVSGSMREVDASIRYNIGSTPILITIECRNRGKVQDDIWIEQLAKKKEKIGASATIAVSRNGFTSPAKKTAKHNNIELRTIKEIEDSTSLEWLKDIKFNVQILSYKLASIKIGLDTDDRSVTVAPIVNEKIHELNYDAYIGSNEQTGEKMFLKQIAEQFMRAGAFPKIAGVIASGRISPNDDMFIATSEGKTKINYVDLELEIISMEQPMAAIKAFDYSSEDGPIIQAAELEYPFTGGSFKVRTLNKLEKG